ncbi:MAG: hypothetical protein KKH94_11290, partial [Candidatus Omnitrophica bacterium]|nr:hypothetical protein [Candidatus Omnitrophota bacterium]
MPFATLQMYKIIVVLFLIGIVCLMIGSGIATVPYQTSLICVASLFIFFLGFLNINVVVGIFILAMLLSPEATVGTVPGRDITIRIEDVVIILLTFIWMGQTAINKNLRLFSPTLLNRTIGLYCTVFILFTARGMIAAKVEPLKGTFYVLKYLEYFVIYFLAANIITSKKQMKIFIAIFLLTFTIVNVYAAMQIGGEAGRVSAPFEIAAGRAGEPNTLGGYQVLLLGITLGLFLYARSFGLKIFLGGLAVFTLWPFIHTYSRSSYMAIIPMYLSFIIFSKKSRL